MNNSFKSKRTNISLAKFLPFFFLEIVITLTMGIMNTAISNHLISELNFEPWIGGFIVSMAPIGFMIFALAFGHISDKYGQRHVICAILVLRLIFSVFYLVPIASISYLIIFGAIYFLDGAVSGLFWPTVQQISVLSEKYGSLELKQKYMSGYNFSWNLGFIFGMFIGAFIVYFFGSNYATFYLNLTGLIFGVIIAFTFVKDVSNLFEIPSNIDLGSNEDSEIVNNKDSLENPNNSFNLKLQEIPLFSVLIVLLIHALTDGVITVFLTVKIDAINQGLYWVFIINLIKLCSQTIATTIFSITRENIILKGLIFSIILSLISWILLILSNTILTICLLFIMSGTGQGTIYALVMKLVSYKAERQKSARPFSLFQTTMSSGRFIGTLLFGFTTTISFSLGILLLVFFDFFSLIQFLIITHHILKKE